jgi:hypothetical protein
MNALKRMAVMAEMHGRDLIRRHMALGLLVLLPACFYAASAGSGPSAVTAGGIGMAFAVSGAALFSVMSSAEADQRLVLGGYRPIDLLMGRLLFLGPLGLAIAAGFGVVMATVSHPQRPWLLGVGLGLVALQSVPFGLAVGAMVPRELEGTLALIGVVGVQLAVRLNALTSKLLPFYGPRRLIDASLEHSGSIAGPVLQTALYGLALLFVARAFVSRRVNVRLHRSA